MATKTALELLAERKGGTATTLELALDQYETWYNASLALSQMKDYTIKNGQNSERRLSRADANEVKMNLDYWENEIMRLQGEPINAPKTRTIFTVGYPQ
jgi:hypothetical protein